MAEVNVIYQKIILEFLFELYVFYALTTRKLNREIGRASCRERV